MKKTERKAKKRRKLMNNYIQLICGIAGVILVFAGLFTVIRKIGKSGEKKRADTDTIIKGTLMVLFGLMAYAVTKTCTNLTTETAADYSLFTVYLASFIEVIKTFGFVLLVPVVLNMLTPRRTEPAKDGK